MNAKINVGKRKVNKIEKVKDKEVAYVMYWWVVGVLTHPS